MRMQLISAKSGSSPQKDGTSRQWGLLAFVISTLVHGAKIEFIASFFTKADVAEYYKAKLESLKKTGVTLVCDIENPAFDSDRSSYVAKDGTTKWTVNHSISGGKVSAMREEARTSSNADFSAIAAVVPTAPAALGVPDKAPA